jgi:hypothetical protein
MKYERLSKQLISPSMLSSRRLFCSSNFRFRSSQPGGEQLTGNSPFFFHFNDPPFNLNTLVSRVKKSGLLEPPANINGKVRDELREPTLIDAIHSCKTLSRLLTSVKGTSGSHTQDIHKLKQTLKKSRKFKTPLHLLESIMEANRPGMSMPVIKVYLSEPPFPETEQAILVIESLFKESHFEGWQSIRSVSDYNDLVYIALRRALLRKEIKYAYELTALTKPSAVTSLNRHTILSNVTFSIMSTSAVIVLSQIFDISTAVTIMSVVCVGLLQYTQLLKQLGTRARVRLRRLSSAVSPSSSIWAQQVWFDMVNRIAIAYDELIDLNVDNFHQMADEHHKLQQKRLEREQVNSNNSSQKIDISLESDAHDIQQRELVKAKLTLVMTDQEQMFNEYWTSAGVGFEWVEPDQDPADVIIKRIRNNY